MYILTLIEAIKKENLRVSNGNRWIHFTGSEWVVYERKYNQKKTHEITRTANENKAVECLLEG